MTVPGHLGVGWRAAQILGQLAGRLAGFQYQFLHGPRDVDRPALVPEVPLDLAADAHLRVGGQVAADRGIETADRLHQPDITHLHQILDRLGTLPVPLHARAHQVAVTSDQQLTRRSARSAGPRQRPHHAQQLPVIQASQIAEPPAARNGRNLLALPRRYGRLTCHRRGQLPWALLSGAHAGPVVR